MKTIKQFVLLLFFVAGLASLSSCKDDEPDNPNTQEWVDLGLPSGTLWATCNVGASAPEEYGDYFAWGETKPKDNYDWNTYKWYNQDHKEYTKYIQYSADVDGKTELDPEDDAAYVNWGPSWRMPTHEQQLELVEQCTWTWTTRNGVYGQQGTGPNGNTIFLPAAGYRWKESLDFAGEYGYYWSRALYPGYSYHVCGLYFSSGGVYWDDYARVVGYAVRAVRVPQN